MLGTVFGVAASLGLQVLHYDVVGYGRDELIADVLSQYERHLNFLYAAERAG